MDAITSAVRFEMVAALAAKDTTLEVWNSVKDMRIGSEAVRKTKVQRLRREFESIKFKDGESVDNFMFMVGLPNLVAVLGMVGETIKSNKSGEAPSSRSQSPLHGRVTIEVTVNLATY